MKYNTEFVNVLNRNALIPHVVFLIPIVFDDKSIVFDDKSIVFTSNSRQSEVENSISQVKTGSADNSTESENTSDRRELEVNTKLSNYTNMLLLLLKNSIFQPIYSASAKYILQNENEKTLDDLANYLHLHLTNVAELKSFNRDVRILLREATDVNTILLLCDLDVVSDSLVSEITKLYPNAKLTVCDKLEVCDLLANTKNDNKYNLVISYLFLSNMHLEQSVKLLSLTTDKYLLVTEYITSTAKNTDELNLYKKLLKNKNEIISVETLKAEMYENNMDLIGETSDLDFNTYNIIKTASICWQNV